MKIVVYFKVLLIFVLSICLLAESWAEGDGGGEPSTGGKIEGVVFDAADSAPVEYANVILFNPSDSSMVSGGLSGNDGSFKIKDIPFGTYYLTIHFIGYSKQFISSITVDENHRNIDLGNISLDLAAINLSAATVTADKMLVEYKLDRKVVNVSRDLDAAGNSAVEILEKAPSIRVDIDGEVYLRGSNNFTVLIDGKPSVLEGSQALLQIPANTIENIEIITNPSVKYDPDGTAGIINIVMKKNRLNGLGGVVNATVGTGDKYATDLFLNYKSGKFNVFGGFDWNDRRFPSDVKRNRETYLNDTVYYRDSNGESTWMHSGTKLKGGIDFSPNDKTTWSVGGEWGNVGFGMDNFHHITEYSNPEDNVRYYINDDHRRWTRDYYSLNGNFKKQFAKKGQELNVFGFYSTRDGTEIQDKIEYETDESWNDIDQEPLLLRTDESGPAKQFRLEADYSHPVGKEGKLETGYHFRRNSEEESYLLQTFDYDRQEWIEDVNYTKHTSSQRNIHAFYGIYSSTYKSLQYQLGLRGEYTFREIKITNTGQTSLIDRFDYFPSIHLSQKLDDKNQFLASYSRRINRPRGYFLEPYETFIDENTRRLGNPDLLPEYTDSYELGYLRTLTKGNFSLDAYYRNTSNKITSIQTIDEESGILYIQFQNLNHEKAAGIESSFMYDLTSWFNLNLSASFYNYRLEDRTSETGGENISNNWDTRAILAFKLPTNTRLQFNLSYQSPTASAQGTREEIYYMDFTIRQEFLKKQLNLTFKVDDVFASRKQISRTYGENLYLYEYRQRESQILSLTLSYRLNNYKPAAPRKGGDGGGDL